MLGDYAGALSADVLTSSVNKNAGPELAELRGRRLVIAAELEEGKRLDTSILKRIASTDPLQVNPKYRQPFSFLPSHTAVLYTNFLPRVGSSDAGTWSRLVVIPCRASFRGQRGEVKNYAEKLFEEAGGAVLQWMIEGARRFIGNGCTLTLPKCVRDEVEAYRDENDWLSQFLEACCVVGDGYTVKASELQTAYRAHCEASGEYCRRSNDFKNALEAAGFKWRKGKSGAVYTGLAVGVAAC